MEEGRLYDGRLGISQHIRGSSCWQEKRKTGEARIGELKGLETAGGGKQRLIASGGWFRAGLAR